ncbi:pol polyprotein-like protein, partial [Dinothrombium tinctorium]
GVEYVWTERQQEAFEKLKEALKTAPIRKHFDDSKPIELHCDASGVGVGVALMQRHDDGKVYPVAFASKKLTDVQQKYPITEQECYAINWGVNYFHEYLDGREFTVITDHSALQWLQNSLGVKSRGAKRLFRWATELSPYNFKIKYRKGKDHTIPDMLSRNPFFECDEEELALPALNNMEVSKIVADQKTDEAIKKIVADRKYGKSKNFFIADDGLVYRKIKNLNQLVIPKTHVCQILDAYHSSKLGAHRGALKTYLSIREKYFWPGMRDDIDQYVTSCIQCQRAKANRKKPHGLMGKYKINFIFERVAMDFVGPFPETEGGNKNLLVACDYLSKFVVALPTKDQTAETAIDFIRSQIIPYWGMPKFLVTDNGPAFIADSFKKFLRELKIIHTKTTPYMPQSNGQVERCNGTIQGMLKAAIESEQDKKNWDLEIPFIVSAYNSSPHAVTKISPFFALYGAKPRNQIDNDYEARNDSANAGTLSEETLRVLDEAREEARNKIKESQNKAAERYNEKHEFQYFLIGDLVMIKNPKHRKLEPAYTGPFLVIKRSKNSPLVYVVQSVENPQSRKIVNIKRMKKFKDREAVFKMNNLELTTSNSWNVTSLNEIQEILENDAPDEEVEIDGENDIKNVSPEAQRNISNLQEDSTPEIGVTTSVEERSIGRTEKDEAEDNVFKDNQGSQGCSKRRATGADEQRTVKRSRTGRTIIPNKQVFNDDYVCPKIGRRSRKTRKDGKDNQKPLPAFWSIAAEKKGPAAEIDTGRQPKRTHKRRSKKEKLGAKSQRSGNDPIPEMMNRQSAKAFKSPKRGIGRGCWKGSQETPPRIEGEKIESIVMQLRSEEAPPIQEVLSRAKARNIRGEAAQQSGPKMESPVAIQKPKYPGAEETINHFLRMAENTSVGEQIFGVSRFVELIKDAWNNIQGRTIKSSRLIMSAKSHELKAGKTWSETMVKLAKVIAAEDRTDVEAIAIEAFTRLYVCALCKMTPIFPVQGDRTRCRHIFCRECVLAFSRRRECPGCGSSMRHGIQGDWEEADEEMQRFAEQNMTLCELCLDTVKISEFRQHVCIVRELEEWKCLYCEEKHKPGDDARCRIFLSTKLGRMEKVMDADHDYISRLEEEIQNLKTRKDETPQKEEKSNRDAARAIIPCHHKMLPHNAALDFANTAFVYFKDQCFCIRVQQNDTVMQIMEEACLAFGLKLPETRGIDKFTSFTPDYDHDSGYQLYNIEWTYVKPNKSINENRIKTAGGAAFVLVPTKLEVTIISPVAENFKMKMFTGWPIYENKRLLSPALRWKPHEQAWFVPSTGEQLDDMRCFADYGLYEKAEIAVKRIEKAKGIEARKMDTGATTDKLVPSVAEVRSKLKGNPRYP